MADLVQQLLARPGRYVGAARRPGDEGEADVARIEVSPLPGGSGAMLSYEVLSSRGEVAHHEHAVVARSSAGIVLVTSHTHADITTVVTEATGEPGWFPAADGTAPFPMAIRIEMPEPGHLVYSWSYGWGDQPLAVRDVADVRVVD
jgi:hypothetical protein